MGSIPCSQSLNSTTQINCLSGSSGDRLNYMEQQACPVTIEINRNMNSEGSEPPPKSMENLISEEQKTIKRILRSEGFYLDANIEGVDILFTIDTGAARTVISERVYNSIPDDQRPKFKEGTNVPRWLKRLRRDVLVEESDK